jgi:hypothetical protein
MKTVLKETSQRRRKDCEGKTKRDKQAAPQEINWTYLNLVVIDFPAEDGNRPTLNSKSLSRRTRVKTTRLRRDAGLGKERERYAQCFRRKSPRI